MKNNLILTALLAATALFGGCSNEENATVPEAGGTTVSFTLGDGGIITRSLTTEESAGYKTVIEANDRIGIYGTGTLAATSNVLATVNTDGNGLTPASDITVGKNSTAVFTAYTPYAEGADETLTFSVKADQSLADDFNASNLLTAQSAEVTAQSPSVSLTFEPRLALVRIEMTGEEGINTSAVKVNAKPQVTWTAATDALNEAAGTATDIAMWHQNATATEVTSQVFAAFTPAQQIAAGTQFLTMTVGEKQYSFKPKNGFSLAAGKINKFKINIDATGGITIEAITIDVKDWEMNDLTTIEGEVEEIIPEPIVLIDDVTNAASADVLQACTGLSVSKEGWNALVDKANTASTITYDEGEAAFKIADDGTGDWYRKMLVFRTPNQAGSLGKYTLTFQVKSTVGKDICVRAMKGQVKDVFTANAFFKVNETIKSSGQALGTTAGAWANKSMTIDLSVLGDQAATADDLAYGVMICFAIKTVTDVDDIYIKNVKCIEVQE